MTFPKIASFRSAPALQEHAAGLGLLLRCDAILKSGPDSPLGRSAVLGARRIGNRFAVLPMEGWDGTPEGFPTELVLRRWRRFGESGAKLIWGCEAAAVRRDGRANPNQLILKPETLGPIAAAREGLVAAHRERWGTSEDPWHGFHDR